MVKGKNSRSTLEIILFCAPFSWTRISCKDRFIVFSSLILLTLYSSLSIYSNILLKDLINHLSQGTVAYVFIISYCLCYFIAECCNNLKSFTFIYVEAKIQSQLSSIAFNHVLKLSLTYHLSRETGKVLKELQRGSISVPQVIRTGLFYVFPIFLQLFLIELYLTLSFDPVYPIILIFSVMFYIAFTIITSEWRSEIQRSVNTSDSSFVARATDALYNCETVKMNSAEDHETVRCSSAFSQFRMSKVTMYKSLIVLHIGQESLVTLGNFLCLGLLAYEVIEGKKLIGDFVMMQGFLTLLYSPLKTMGTYYETIKQALIDSEGIMNLLDFEEEIKEDKNSIVMGNCIGKVEFRNVEFRYCQNLPWVTSNVGFVVSPGGSLGVVGQTGSGKSTLSKLLYRLYDPTAGAILVDDYDIRLIKLSSLHSQIAIVPQDCALFNDTIAYNIGYACTSDINQIHWAAFKSQIHDFIISLPQGYNTIVGEKGLRLSGGEKQRIAIARALIRKPKILCFDEATSSLDSITEDQIHLSIQEISRNFTSIIIAHRLSSIVNCDQIIVMDSGLVIERGKHEELVEAGGKYSELWKQQLERIN